jgi:hypothetical protein
MLRKMVFGLMAVATMALIAPTEASARGGFGHGGGGFHGGGFRGGGWRGGGVGIGLGLGLAGAGLYGGYGGYVPYGYGGYPYAIGGYDDEGGCYLVRRRIMTPAGYRMRRVEVCE